MRGQWKCFITVAVGLGAIAGFFVHAWSAGAYNPNLETQLSGKDFAFLYTPASGADVAAESAAGWAWSTAAFLLVCACSIATFAVWTNIREAWKDPGWPTVMWASGTVAIASLTVLTLLFTVGGKRGGFGGPVVNVMLNALDKRGNFQIAWFNPMLNIVGVLMTGILGLAMSLCYSTSTSLSVLARHLNRLDRLLLVGAILLSAAVLEVATLLAWPTAPYSSVAEVAKTVDIAKKIHEMYPLTSIDLAITDAEALRRASVVDLLRLQAEASTFAAGTGFTVLLLCFYVPNTMMLRAQANTAAVEMSGEARDVDAIFKQYGISTSWLDRVWSAAVVAAPLLIGLITRLTGIFERS